MHYGFREQSEGWKICELVSDQEQPPSHPLLPAEVSCNWIKSYSWYSKIQVAWNEGLTNLRVVSCFEISRVLECKGHESALLIQFKQHICP